MLVVLGVRNARHPGRAGPATCCDWWGRAASEERARRLHRMRRSCNATTERQSDRSRRRGVEAEVPRWRIHREITLAWDDREQRACRQGRGTRSLRLAKRQPGDRGRGGPPVRPLATQHVIVLAQTRPPSKPGALSQSPKWSGGIPATGTLARRAKQRRCPASERSLALLESDTNGRARLDPASVASAGRTHARSAQLLGAPCDNAAAMRPEGGSRQRRRLPGGGLSARRGR